MVFEAESIYALEIAIALAVVAPTTIAIVEDAS